MDIKEEVRRRIADLTRLAYERGYRDGAQTALAEIENIAAADVAQQLDSLPQPLEAITQTESQTVKAGAAKTTGAKPKSVVVQEALRALLVKQGEARRDEVLAAAQAENPAITKFDLANGVRTLVKRGEIKAAADDQGLYLSA